MFAMKFDDVLNYVILPLTVALLASALGALSKWLISKASKDKIKVKEIRSEKDKDINEFAQLYNSRIAPEIRICVEQIIEFVTFKNDDDILHHLYICKNKENVVGFIKIIESLSKKYIFIAYIAINESDSLARKDGVKSLIDYVIKKHIKHKDEKIQIFTEIERGANNGYVTKLSKMIARRTRAYGYDAYSLKFDYIQPNMPDEAYENKNEHVLSLIWIPCYKITKPYLTKTEVINICKNLYFDIYSPSCNCSNNCSSYKEYLRGILSQYHSSLPKRIQIECMNQRRSEGKK